MHVDNDRNEQADRVKKIAMLGMMAAISAVLLILGTLISVNTVFFTALASFLVGIMVVRYGFGSGLMLYLGAALLDLLLNPDKFHIFLYLAMAGFVLVGEGSYKLFEKRIPDPKKRNGIHLMCRILVFFAGYVPLVIWLPRLFLTGEAVKFLLNESWITWAMLGAGVVAFIVYDFAYLVVKRTFLHIFRY